MPIRHAVITAAGLGTRFLPATKNLPKEMLPLIDRPVIQFVVEEVVASGLQDILMVTGRHKRAVEDHFDLSPELQSELRRRGRPELARAVLHAASLGDLHFVRQKRPKGLGDAVLCAERHVGGEPFGLLLADDIIRSDVPCLAQMMEVYERERCCVVAVEEVPPDEVGRYGIVAPAAGEDSGAECFHCAGVVEKPERSAAPSNVAIIGRYVLTPDVFERLRNLTPGAGGEIQLSDALAGLAAEGRVVAYRYHGTRWDTGQPAALLKSAILYAMERPDLQAEMVDFLRGVLAESDAPPRAASGRA